MDDCLDDVRPISEARETWKVKMKHPDYQQAFDAIAQYADDIVNGRKEYGIICDGPTQSLIVYYDDGSKKRLLNQCAILMERGQFAMNLKTFLPDQMMEAIANNSEEDDE